MEFNKIITWNLEKNEKLKTERNICFEDVLSSLNTGSFKKTIKHPNKEKYGNQKMLLIEIFDYIYCVPYIEGENEIFFKTVFPSRKHTKLYLNK